MGLYSSASRVRAPIALSQESEVRYWTRALGVEEGLLREAIAIVGSDELAVRLHLLGLRRDPAAGVAALPPCSATARTPCPG